MELNIELSTLLHDKYKTKNNHCYDNSYKVFEYNDCEKYVIGYIKSNNGNLVRHSWNVKDNKIIDTTLFYEMDKLAYLSLFEFNKDNIIVLMKKCENNTGLNYDLDKEIDFIKNNTTDNNFLGTILFNNKEAYIKLFKEGHIKVTEK